MIRAGYYMVKAFLKKLREDNVSAFAAQTAFFVILSFLPFLIFLLTLLKFLPVDTESMLTAVHSFFPPKIHELIGLILEEVMQKTSGTLLSISVVTALWSASRGILVIIRGMNEVYGNHETRSYFLLRFLSVCYTFIFALVLILTLVLLVFGNQIYLYIQSRVPFLEDAAFLIISFRTVASFLILAVFFWALYLFIPNRKSRNITVELPGALLGAAGWMGFSYLYSFYIDHLSDFSAMYGSLTAIVLCMIWLYACMYIMFIGGELNAVVSDTAVRQAWQEFVCSLKRKGKRNKAGKKGNTVKESKDKNETGR